MPPTPMAKIAECLFLDGRIKIGRCESVSHSDMEATAKILMQNHALAVAEAPGQAPELHIESALWAMQTLYWGVGIFVNRSEIQTALPADLKRHQPNDASPNVQWSVDLVFRFLPSLIHRSHLIAQDDGLSKTLSELANAWPLCVAELDDELVKTPSLRRLELIASNTCLRGVLIDRIFRYKSRWLATHELFSEKLRAAAGLNTPESNWLCRVQKPSAENEYQSINEPA